MQERRSHAFLVIKEEKIFLRDLYSVIFDESKIFLFTFFFYIFYTNVQYLDATRSSQLAGKM